MNTQTTPTCSSLETLVGLLSQVEQSEEIPSHLTGDTGSVYITDEYSENPLIEEVVGLANGCLIASSGDCNWRAHADLRARGYAVTCGEKDSFGWLTGCIHTNKGIIVYG